MGRVVLVTGGCRSGKSAHAQAMAEDSGLPRVYVATAGVYDDEMRARVDRHKADRAGRGWRTLEAPVALADALEGLAPEAPMAVVVDCLTLWLSNRFFLDGAWESASEADAAAAGLRLAETARKTTGLVIFVTNEVGWGVVPDNAMARKFRDLAGRLNQTLAQAADEVVLTACGLPLTLKGQPHG
jgi:adenosylcobinamide kinase/adenosylcobinamide-phosphate guanylyltransferase